MNRFNDMFIEECGDVSFAVRPKISPSALQLISPNKKILDDTIPGIDALANIGNAVNTANDAQYVGLGANASGLYNWKAGDTPRWSSTN